jgi:PilZ domain
MRLQLEDSSDRDRRTNGRFPLENALRYRFVEAKNPAPAGTGQTLNMSSSGMLFKVESPLPVGQKIEVSVDWPAQLNEHCGLKLVALGKVIRSSAEEAAVSIDKYDFRTRATKALEVAASASSL